jgi:hypothetical protein
MTSGFGIEISLQLTLMTRPVTNESARSNSLDFSGQLPFEQLRQSLARRNPQLSGNVIYRKFNKLLSFGPWTLAYQNGIRQAQLLQDIDRRLHELCPVPQERVRAAVAPADDRAGHRHDVPALIGREPRRDERSAFFPCFDDDDRL